MELRECPFCGSDDIENLPAIRGPEDPVWFPAEITCRVCSANTDTVEQWNTRASDTTIKELVEALEHICTKNPWLVMDQEFSVKIKQLLSEHRKP